MKSRLGRPRPTSLVGIVFLLDLIVSLGGLGSGVARAATVVVVRSPRHSAVTTEATVRLRGELVSAGFDVQVIDPPPGKDIRTSLEEAAAGPDVEAVVAIMGGAGGDVPEDSAELWVIDRVTGKTVVRRVSTQVGSPRAAEMLSVRALELLRASFMEVALAAGRTPKNQPKPPPPSPEVARFANIDLVEAAENRTRSARSGSSTAAAPSEPWAPSAPSGWAVEAGGSVLGSFDGVKPALVPTLRVQRSLGDHLLGRITLAGFGTRSRQPFQGPPTGTATPPLSGTAEITQEFGLIEVAVRFRGDRTLRPFLSAGAGALHIAAVARPSLDYLPPSRGRWAVLADAGAGIRIPLGGRFEAALEIHAQAAQPYPVIRFLTVDVASEGRPTLISSLSVILWI